MAVKAIIVGRRVPKKTKSVSATKAEAAISLPFRLLMDASINEACRKVTRGDSIPEGKPALSSSRASSTDSVKAMVSAVGCFWTPRMTAGLPPKPASPRLIAAANSTEAICCRVITCPSRIETAMLRRSFNLEVCPRFRMRYSRSLSSRNPPEVLAENPLKADSRSP